MSIPDLFEFLREVARNRFYGVIEIRYEAGHVAIIRKTEFIKVIGDEPIRFREVNGEQHSR